MQALSCNDKLHIHPAVSVRIINTFSLFLRV
jgi:hypothetical protein